MYTKVIISIVIIALLSEGHASSKRSARLRRNYDAVDSLTITPNNRTFCPETEANKPPNRVYTADRVKALRAFMADDQQTGGVVLDAYIIHYGDEHLGRSVPDFDKRLQFISGYSGSSGYAVITKTKAALWTDGRYFTQADQQMDCDWIMMKMQTSGYPTIMEWVKEEVGSTGLVGADPRLVSISNWLFYSDNVDMREVPTDLVDLIWEADRPSRLNNPLDIHNLTFAGVKWEDKVRDVRTKMTEQDADVLVVSALDETAWLFNLRGRDRETSPLFDAYTLLTSSDISLYVRNVSKLLTSEIMEHLNTKEDGDCAGQRGDCVKVLEYATVTADIKSLSQSTQINSIWVSPNSNYALYSSAGSKRDVSTTPIELMKSVKNSVEREHYYKCQVRDSAALIEFITFLEKEIAEGNEWTELSAGQKLTEIRSTYEYNWGISFTPISSVGANAAIIHYRPDNNTDRRISKSEVYLLDSGGQYQDCTTDVTRTFHFGTPTDEEKEAYTRVLMAHIDLATTVWPSGLRGNEIDARTRVALWERGWDYRHGTGHGIGYFLNVHEGPGRIGISYRGDGYAPLAPGMFFSDEPGFYREGSYGIRIESIMGIEKANTKERFGNIDYLAFRASTLVPMEPKLIMTEMLNQKQRQWLNAYNKRCEEETGEYLLKLGKKEAHEWLKSRTKYIPDFPVWTDPSTSAASGHNSVAIKIVSLTMFFLSVSKYQLL